MSDYCKRCGEYAGKTWLVDGPAAGMEFTVPLEAKTVHVPFGMSIYAIYRRADESKYQFIGFDHNLVEADGDLNGPRTR